MIASHTCSTRTPTQAGYEKFIILLLQFVGLIYARSNAFILQKCIFSDIINMAILYYETTEIMHFKNLVDLSLVIFSTNQTLFV